jgi:hypothetical protein
MNSVSMIRFAKCIFVVLACSVFGAVAQAQAPLPSRELVAGQLQADWAVRWWQWALSFGDGPGPISDESGSHCAAKQDGPVWFLAGAWSDMATADRPIVRTCAIPKGKHVFFPIINSVVTPDAAPGKPRCASFQRAAAKDVDAAVGIFFELDGVRTTALASNRLPANACFDAGEQMNPKQKIFPTAADGYYVMLAPLPSGQHTIKFGGRANDNVQNVVYKLVVE